MRTSHTYIHLNPLYIYFARNAVKLVHIISEVAWHESCHEHYICPQCHYQS